MSVIKSILHYFLFLIVFIAVFIPVRAVISLIILLFYELDVAFILKLLGFFSLGIEVGMIGISCAVSHFAASSVLHKMESEYEENILFSLGITFIGVALFSLVERIIIHDAILVSFVPAIYGIILIRKKFN